MRLYHEMSDLTTVLLLLYYVWRTLRTKITNLSANDALWGKTLLLEVIATFTAGDLEPQYGENGGRFPSHKKSARMRKTKVKGDT